MMVLWNYTFQGVEYMVWDAAMGDAPGTAAVELLCNRHYGIGADCLLLVDAQAALRVLAADGAERETEAMDRLVLACHLRRHGRSANAAALVKALGDQALVRMQQMEASLSCFEVRLTDTFCAKLAALDRVAETLAC